MKLWKALILLVLVPSVARAQVGYEPEESPFRDLRGSQTLTAFAGYFSAGEDPAGVAPQSAPMLGARYEVRLGGPAQFVVRLATTLSDRTVVDPGKTGDARVVGTESWPIYLADAGIAVNLTGQKSWHYLVPSLHGGLGVATDLHSDSDVGQYAFGTTFALTLGAGVRWVRDRIQLRADLTDYLYQIKYPDTYYVQPPGGTPVLPSSQAASLWKHNAALTIGASIALFR